MFDVLGRLIQSKVESNLWSLSGYGIFSSDGHAWSVARKTTSHIFSKNLFDGSIKESIDQEKSNLQANLSLKAESEESFDLFTVLSAFTLDAFARLAFSHELHCLSAGKAERIPFAAAFDKAQLILVKRLNNPLWPVYERFFRQGKEMKTACQEMDRFAYALIDARENLIQSGQKPSTDLLTLFSEMK